MRKMIAVALTVGALCFLGFAGTHAQVSHRGQGTGEEWLSWSADERIVFVGAYLQGYLMGKTDACEAAAELFQAHKKFTNLEQDPSRRCFRHAKDYSRSAAEYAPLITDFYTKHPEHRDIPVDYFMLLLTNDQYKTVGDIEQGIQKGEVRTTF